MTADDFSSRRLPTRRSSVGSAMPMCAMRTAGSISRPCSPRRGSTSRRRVGTTKGRKSTGVSPTGRSCSARGSKRNREGFVAEVPAGLLASFDVPAVPPADASIVGVWAAPDSPQQAIAFLADGTYFQVDTSHGIAIAAENTSGFERGRYTWNSSTGQLTFATLQDTNGSVGLSGANGTLAITGRYLATRRACSAAPSSWRASRGPRARWSAAGCSAIRRWITTRECSCC